MALLPQNPTDSAWRRISHHHICPLILHGFHLSSIQEIQKGVYPTSLFSCCVLVGEVQVRFGRKVLFKPNKSRSESPPGLNVQGAKTRTSILRLGKDGKNEEADIMVLSLSPCNIHQVLQHSMTTMPLRNQQSIPPTNSRNCM